MEVLKETFEDELGKKTTYYDDDLIDVVLLREITPKDPTPAIGFLVLEARPEVYEIGQHYPSDWKMPLQIQLIVKHGSQEEGLELIRKLVRRIFLCLFRDTTSTAILITDTMGTLTEQCVRYNLVSRNYASTVVTGGFVFAATLDMEFFVTTKIA